jgi:hypothetical protein
MRQSRAEGWNPCGVGLHQHDADALELLLAENRLAGDLGVADAGERVVGRCFGESGVNAVVLDVADGDA